MSTRSFSVATSTCWASIVPFNRSRSAVFSFTCPPRLPTALASWATSPSSTRCSRAAMRGGTSAGKATAGTGPSARLAERERAAARRATSARSDWRSAWSVPSSAWASPGSSVSSTWPAATRAPFCTAIPETLPVSSGWMVLVRPTGWILPWAVAMMSTRPT